MYILVYGIAYLAVLVFLGAVAYRLYDYIKKPMHIRWELYPVAHEGKKAAYGGGYLEEVDWWKKPREKSRIGELKVMIPEILLLHACWEHNRPLWYRTYPFHLGLYLIIGCAAFLGLGAVFQLFGWGGSSLAGLFAAAAKLLGPLGFILCIGGAIGLVLRRMSDPALKKYTGKEHFVNLYVFIIAMSVSLLTWLGVDPNFDMARNFLANMISFSPAPLGNALFSFQVLLIFLVLAYTPLTHMSHFFMKYFLYHDIRWGDEPNIDSPATEAKIGVVLNYPVTWAASHIRVADRKTWAEVATFNPMAEEIAEK